MYMLNMVWSLNSSCILVYTTLVGIPAKNWPEFGINPLKIGKSHLTKYPIWPMSPLLLNIAACLSCGNEKSSKLTWSITKVQSYNTTRLQYVNMFNSGWRMFLYNKNLFGDNILHKKTFLGTPISCCSVHCFCEMKIANYVFTKPRSVNVNATKCMRGLNFSKKTNSDIRFVFIVW